MAVICVDMPSRGQFFIRSRFFRNKCRVHIKRDNTVSRQWLRLIKNLKLLLQ